MPQPQQDQPQQEQPTSQQLFAALENWRSIALDRAKQAGVDAAEVDWLLLETTGWTALDRIMHRPPQKHFNLAWLDDIWQQRISHRIPLQQLLQSVTWRQLRLAVTDAVLIPRPETELLVDIALREVETFSEPGLWVDMGTGSGAIAIGMASEQPNLSMIAVDTSPAALDIARMNVQRQGLERHITVLEGNWFEEPFPSTIQNRLLQGMVSNPPYIPSAVVEELEPEVRDREPRLALDGGNDGLASIRKLVDEAPKFLQQEGCWIVELMHNQARDVAKRLKENGCYQQIEIHRDLEGNERFVSARRI